MGNGGFFILAPGIYVCVLICLTLEATEEGNSHLSLLIFMDQGLITGIKDRRVCQGESGHFSSYLQRLDKNTESDPHK